MIMVTLLSDWLGKTRNYVWNSSQVCDKDLVLHGVVYYYYYLHIKIILSTGMDRLPEDNNYKFGESPPNGPL